MSGHGEQRCRFHQDTMFQCGNSSMKTYTNRAKKIIDQETPDTLVGALHRHVSEKQGDLSYRPQILCFQL